MRKFTIIFTILFHISFLCCFLNSATKSTIFNHLSTDDGLSQLSINDLYIDEHGMLWIGTRVGLNVYDGNKIHTFKSQKDNPFSLPSNLILKVSGNKNGKIFILSTDGVSEFNKVTRKFSEIHKGKADCIYYHDKLYISKKNTVYVYNEKTLSIDAEYTLPSDAAIINSMIFDTSGCPWFGTTQGIYKYDTANQQYIHIIPSGNITQLYIDNTESLWAGSWEDGVYEISKHGDIKNYKSDNNNNGTSVSSNFVRAICQDDEGNIWLGTFNGLDKYDKSCGKFIHYSSGNSGLSHSSVWCIEKDKQGTFWIGTYFGGVNYINPEYSIYNRYEFSTKENQGLSSPIVGRMVEDNKGNLWIATEGGGVNYLERSTNSFRWLTSKQGQANTLSHNNVKALFFDERKNTLWIGTHTGGLNRYDIAKNKITIYKSEQGDTSTLPSDIIRDIEEYTSDTLVIATQNGICLFSKENGKCRQLLNNLPGNKKIGMVADITFDNYGDLWIAATGEGAYVYNLKTGRVKNYRHDPNNTGSISNNNINDITKDSKGNVWFSTSGSGLDLYVPSTDSFINYDKKSNKLGNDCIYQAAELPLSGNLLLITTDGFSIFNPTEKIFHNYNSETGFPIDDINENALYIAKDGEIFLGGIHNMVSFFEDDLEREPKPYSIIPIGLLVNGQYINVNDSSRILNKSIEYTDNITLSHKQNMLCLEFAVTNFIPENRNNIIYKLDGFSEQWTDTRNSNEITYTNLHPGNYTLIVKPEGVDESVCKPLKLNIKIKAPFYQTPLAFILYILTAIAIIWYLISIYITRLRMSESLKLEQQHAENIKKENQAQLKLFTNISHEFRTPLTLIISQIETLIQNNKLNQQTYSKLSSMYHSCMQLRELITELLDYRKHELGHLKLQVTRGNIVSFLKENYLLFSDYASRESICLEFTSSHDDIEMWYDSKQIQKVINNLLFNAIKYTPKGGKISINISKDINKVNISITDNGEGIPEKDLTKIFDIFYQSDNSVNTANGISGSGIGLALVKSIVKMHHGEISVNSKINEGSTFTFTLPLGDELYSETEKGPSISQEENPTLLNDKKPITLKDAHESQTTEEEDEPFEENVSDKPKMMIVEDNTEIRNIIREILSPFYTIHDMSDAESALSEIEKIMPDIVITDVMMPGMDGKELCRKIKTSPATSHIPVILLTAQTAVEQYIEGFQTGADDYITKPFNARLLISRCNNLVNSRILLQEKFSHRPETNVQMLATNKLDKEILDKAITIIEENIGNAEFNMNTFAREMGMARTNLFAKIKAITGQTPNDFITSIRLKRGAHLLRNNPELNITEIAEKLGFSSARYFSKCFKDLYNISPLSYRKDKTEEQQPAE